jgi:Cu/Zn superoxide dismutase
MACNCNAKTGFTSAGQILSLTPGKNYGYLAADGPLAGDLPNQFAAGDGTLHASIVTTGFNLGNGKRTIFDRDGVAIILDQRGDDYRTPRWAMPAAASPAAWWCARRALQRGSAVSIRKILSARGFSRVATLPRP